jgi:hypothetical protein
LVDIAGSGPAAVDVIAIPEFSAFSARACLFSVRAVAAESVASAFSARAFLRTAMCFDEAFIFIESAAIFIESCDVACACPIAGSANIPAATTSVVSFIILPLE